MSRLLIETRSWAGTYVHEFPTGLIQPVTQHPGRSLPDTPLAISQTVPNHLFALGDAQDA